MPAITRREALRLLGFSVPGVLLLARSVHSQPTAMLTRPIPRTGEALPVVGLGTAVNFDAGGDTAKQTQVRVRVRSCAPRKIAAVRSSPLPPRHGTHSGKAGGVFVEGRRNQEGVVGPTGGMESPQMPPETDPGSQTR